MKHIKDFIHNTNDILLALVIVAIAAAVIWWHLNIILAYPEKMAKESVHVSEETVQTEVTEGAADGAAEKSDEAASASDDPDEADADNTESDEGE